MNVKALELVSIGIQLLNVFSYQYSHVMYTCTLMSLHLFFHTGMQGPKDEIHYPKL